MGLYAGGVYYGRICEKHPDAKGRRHKSTHLCTVCVSEKNKEKRVQRLKERGRTYLGKVCFRHPHLKGLRRTSSRTCVGCDKCDPSTDPLSMEMKMELERERVQRRIQSLLDEARALGWKGDTHNDQVLREHVAIPKVSK